MKIISPSSELVAAPETRDLPPSNHLLRYHPAAVLFESIVVEHSVRSCTLEFQLGDARWGRLRDIRAVAGCVVDLSVRLAGEKALGRCELSEYEMRVCAPFIANTLSVSVDIDSTQDRYATFHCAIYGQPAPIRQLLAESHGTLLRSTSRSATLPQATRQESTDIRYP